MLGFRVNASAQMESTEDEKDSEKDKEKMSDGEETTSVEERVSNFIVCN